MNEPSVFNVLGLAMPDSNKHYGGLNHCEIKNAYGLQMQKATYEALL
jgi:alpha-glucosidase (family GH31 glycosyl hydrolase)